MNASLIIIAFNRLNQLKETLLSIHYEHLTETILVDDGSMDGTGEWVSKNYPDIRIIRLEKEHWLNPARTRNIGVANAKGDIVIIQDAECRHVSDAVGQALAHFQQRASIMVTPQAPIYQQFGLGTTGPNPAYRYLFMAMWKEDYIALGDMNEFYTQWGNEDVEFETRWLRAGYSIIADPSIETMHLAHQSIQGDEQRWKFECEFHQWYSDRLKAGLGDPRLIWQH